MSALVPTEERVAVDEESALAPAPLKRKRRNLAKPLPQEPAGEELFYILDRISDQLGPEQAIVAAREFRQAAQEGRINGRSYGQQPSEREACVACAIGTLGRALGYGGLEGHYDDEGHWQKDAAYHALSLLPGWHTRFGRNSCRLTPIERWVLDVRQEHTAETNYRLQTIVDWINQWSQDRGLPLD